MLVVWAAAAAAAAVEVEVEVEVRGVVGVEGVAVFVVVVGEARLAERAGVWDRSKCSGNAGRYLWVLNPAPL